MKRTLTRILVCIVIAALAIAGFKRKPTTPEKPTESDQLVDDFNQGNPKDASDIYKLQVAQLEQLDQQVTINKAGKLMGSSNITISAQANGRVELINKKEGENMVPGTVIVGLSDSVANYGILRERAQVALNRAKLNYQQSDLQLTKAVTDAQNALKKAQNDYIITKEKLEQSVRKSKIALENAQLSGVTSASLEIEKLQTELNNQLLSLKNSFQSQKITIEQLSRDVLDEVDSQLGMTSIYKGTASRRNSLLGVRNSAAKTKAKQLFRDLKNTLESTAIASMPTNDDELKSGLDQIAKIYNSTEQLLTTMVIVIDSSLEGPGFSTTEIAGFQTAIDTLRTAYQTKYAAFVIYQNSVNSIYSDLEDESIDTTLEQQIAIIKKNAEVSFENAELAYDQAVTAAKDGLFTVDLNLKIATENLDISTQNKTLQLALLRNAILDADVALRDTQRQFNKLSIATPINAIVQEVLVDKGQEVSVGTPIAKIVGTQNNEILVSLDEEEITNITVGQAVQIKYLNKGYSGTVISVGSVADATLSYPVSIKVDENIGQLGGSVSVVIPLDIQTIVIPLKAVEIIGKEKGRIYILQDNIPQQSVIEVGQVRGDKIEIKTEIDKSTPIILTDMNNYDPEIHTIQISQ